MDEDEHSRLNRELIELLNELRVALPAVQLLFAFLLTVPFTTRFAAVTAVQRAVFFGIFICTTVSLVLLIAPSVHHRLEWRARSKEQLLLTANRFAIWGQFLLFLSVIALVFLITDVLFNGLFSTVFTGIIALAMMMFWYVVPLRRKRQRMLQNKVH